MTSDRLAALRSRKEAQPSDKTRAIDNEEILVGVDVLELVSSAMYVDPMTIYREYVQNAADAIDEARGRGLLGADQPGQVEIGLDPSTRSIRIRDNGSGIESADFVRRLAALGASRKRGTTARGFRGVGRLAGLGYAQELIFRSRVTGEDLISELCWDCRKLRTELRSGEARGDVADLISGIASFRLVDAIDQPERFFEVELKGVVRLRSDRLMSPTAVVEYLSQVAPVPFSPDFSFGEQIAAGLRTHLELGELEIRVTGLDGIICRPHHDGHAADIGKPVSFDSVEFVEVPSIDGGIAGVGWILHHDYEGAIPTGLQIKGFRVRSGNIQIGDNTLLEELFPEPRFNAWTIGELHVIDRRIVPNGRRDNFEQNAHFNNLVNHLVPAARGIARRCRTNSVRRKWLREFELQTVAAREQLDIIAQAGISGAGRNQIALGVEQALLKMEKIAEIDLVSSDSEAFNTTIEAVRSELAQLMRDEVREASPLIRLPAEKREMYQHLFGLIYECSTNRIAAKALVDRILLKLS
ncbi:ATP-binding protein [Mesorhizobium sp.]|uniref:ATP-binding protein n=1 Tax=Mesorhizobium sp. TaxID=1871066 RepID=UPI000FE2DBB7|nr:ATP-binding protein [Mesorhizobium sp.]RWO36779.1 MAG: molecular chaperone Hsp90 [Mesorhizobium sp.]TIN23064.1 MAG: molecular chaperone Hsp90 [Mesorhizobium sp.]